LALALPVAARADLAAGCGKVCRAMGHVNDAAATRKIFDPLQPKDPVSAAGLKADRDIAYGSDPLQKLDVVWDGKTTGNRPVLVFVHGGGFTGGDKHTPGQFSNDNLMKWANEQGMVAVDINYRLAPKNVLPDQTNDARDALGLGREEHREIWRRPEQDVPLGSFGRREPRRAVRLASRLLLQAGRRHYRSRDDVGRL
jgi:triacylglycerol lipase